MILTVLTWTVFLISSITSSSIEDSIVEKKLPVKSDIYDDRSIEMTEIPNIRAKRTFRKIKSLSPRSGVAQSFFKSDSPVPNHVDYIKSSGSVDSDNDNDSSFGMSNVSESFLGDLGLRSRPSTPSLPSPSQKLRKMGNSPSSSLIFFSKRNKLEGSQSSSDEFSSDSFEFESSGFESDKTWDYQFDFVDIDADYTESKVPEIIVPKSEFDEMEIETGKVVTEEKKSTLKLTHIPETLLSNVLEFCSDTSLLQIRLIDKQFKSACDNYLNFLAKLTLKPSKPAEVLFESKYHLSSTMMPFYRNQPQVRDMMSSLLKSERPWNSMSLIELSDSRIFKELGIFSDEFIINTLLPHLEMLSRIYPTTTEPSPFFLFGEALLKSKRFELFNDRILPILNRISFEMLSGLPATEYLSPNFLNLSEDQRVLGATLHAAIGYNLNFSVKHFVKLQVDIINSKNHYGVTALLKIVEYLAKNCAPIEVDEENILDWIQSVNMKFSQGHSIQETFPNNSFLAFEMFLEILNQVSEMFPSREELISILGFNQEYRILVRTPSGNFFPRDTTLLHELVQAQQYDLIYTLGFYFGGLIQSLQDINPLHMAAEMNDPALVAILLNFYSQIDVNALTASGHTAIGLVVGKQMRSLKVLLRDSRADPNLHNSVSPLIRMIEIGNTETVKLLLNHPSIDIHHQITVNSKTLSPLGAAVARRRWDVLHLLLRNPNNKFNIDQDSAVMQSLGEAEKALMKFGEKYYDLILMVRRIILPTIAE